MLDRDNVERMIEAGYIKRQYNDDGYELLSYTDACQWDRQWNNETLRCRGLVLTPDGTVQSRCLPKFFNWNEHAEGIAPYDVDFNQPFSLFEKLDGSMILASRMASGDILFTSRGSFTSWHAHTAREMFQGDIPEGETWMFELIHPNNRIVVQYGERSELVLLARMVSHTGEELPLEWDGPVARKFDSSDFDDVLQMLGQIPGAEGEGFILRFEDGARVKAKSEDYVRLHKLMTGLTPRKIWECLAAGQALNDLLDGVPDEFYQWAREIATDLTRQKLELQLQVVQEHARVAFLPTRKEQALALATSPVRACVFRALDRKSYQRMLWQMVYPEAIEPFSAAS